MTWLVTRLSTIQSVLPNRNWTCSPLEMLKEDQSIRVRGWFRVTEVELELGLLITGGWVTAAGTPARVGRALAPPASAINSSTPKAPPSAVRLRSEARSP